MKNFPDLKLCVLCGTVCSLKVVVGEEEFLQTMQSKVLGTGVGAALAVSELAGAAVAASIATTSSTDSVQFFTCTVNGKPIAGRFSKVGFKNGDAVEVVCQPQEDDTYMAQAVRRRSDQTLWMAPHCSRGNQAHWIYAWKMVPVTISVVIFSMGLLLIFAELHSARGYSAEFLWMTSGIWVFFSTLIGGYFPLKFARQWRSFVNIAEQVYKALGYENPTRVDMEKQNSRYWKKHAKPGEVRSGAPWVFRYVDER
jgi:hypothetical protein